MKPVMIGSVPVGEGMPKICLPIVGRDTESACAQAAEFKKYHCDIAEWRVDWFDRAGEPDQLAGCAGKLRKVLGGIPLLLTFRTKEEGGERSITDEDYISLCSAAAEQHWADAVDVELFRGGTVVSEIIRRAHAAGTAVVVSNHNFTMTPPQQEIVSRLQHAQKLGGDILKIAVMPRTAQDVLTLLSATEEASRVCEQPLITMSMGRLGVVSRLAGETFGSAVTFGAAGKASAPGQVSADRLYDILCTLHG